MAVPKHRYIVWLAVQSKLLTREKRLRFIPDLDVVCLVCEAEPETHKHLFFCCHFSNALLSQVVNWLGIAQVPYDFQFWQSRLLNVKKSFADMVCITALQAVVYAIWLNRNSCFFSKVCHTTDHWFQTIQMVVKCRLMMYRKRVKSIADRSDRVL